LAKRSLRGEAAGTTNDVRPIEPARNTLDEEHPQLASVARPSIGLVERLHDTLRAVEGQSVWLQHGEFAWRAWHLVDHLLSALDDADRSRYATAFGTLRTAMEHTLVDRLLLMADRYVEVIEAMTDDQFVNIEAELAAGEADWTTNTLRLERWGNGARLVREGHNVMSDGVVVERISPYWAVLKHDNAPPTRLTPSLRRAPLGQYTSSVQAHPGSRPASRFRCHLIVNDASTTTPVQALWNVFLVPT
jgi:hypothetical protein